MNLLSLADANPQSRDPSTAETYSRLLARRDPGNSGWFAEIPGFLGENSPIHYVVGVS